jgi:hypothetical protein
MSQYPRPGLIHKHRAKLRFGEDKSDLLADVNAYKESIETFL